MPGRQAPAVLLMAYGSPNSLDEVGPYLSQVRGREPSAEDVERLKERYRKVGGRTPLLEITQRQARALEAKLRAQQLDIPVYIGMKHWHPFIEDTVREIVRNEPSSIIGIALAPHYSKLSIGGYEDRIVKGLEAQGKKNPHTIVKNWHTEESLITALSNHVSEGLRTLEEPENAVVLFTAHSLPKKAVSPDDPYRNQLLETSNLIAKRVGLNHWSFAFQSAGEPKDNWLGPQIREQTDKLANDGFAEILVCPVGFVSDHLEILYDLDVEAKEHARSLGVKLDRTTSLNDDPEFIDALASVTVSSLKTPPLAAT